jgi:uncharacterized protein (TIGR00369 family)
MTDSPDAQPGLNGPIPGFDGLYGLELQRADPDEVRGRVEIDDRHLQPFGLVHGGVYSSVAETVASAMTYAAVAEEGMLALGQSNTANFLRPILDGHVHATGHVIHRGRTSWVWDVECADDDGRVAAVVRVVIAVRPRPS